MVGAATICFTKLTLLLLYLRLFSQNTAVNWGIHIGILFCALYYPLTLFLWAFINPAAYAFLVRFGVVVGAVTDVYLLNLPLFAVARLHLGRAKKWRVAAVFLTGLFAGMLRAVAMSILACTYNFQGNPAGGATQISLPIYIVGWVFAFYNSTPITTHSMATIPTNGPDSTVELDIGITCSCLPVMPALFRDPQASRPPPTRVRSVWRPLRPSWLGPRLFVIGGLTPYRYSRKPASLEDVSNIELVRGVATPAADVELSRATLVSAC
ncbi:uncharacterized protein DSM5745_07894 [Aspergillus mulundensis]|uniref:Rhodopsin domain-containing protein n=1 Tax=Aspergillus mulundensis TaxID=1810919 RepID=A0A3D8RFA7_9EURO|nr:hypothetical protein DSM5745_07894 [Aspergillus mulundensis]RDW72722.1 hypothetical protein DSM5745_07894 [Aspergillus mulundensis]